MTEDTVGNTILRMIKKDVIAVKTVSQEASRQVRAFNRFYSKVMGALNQSVLDSPFSIAEARVLFEIKHLDSPTASEINRELGLDPGYLSRIIRRFEQDGLLTKERSPQDGRAFLLKLSEQGSKILTSLEKKADKRAAELLSSLPERDQPLLLRSMGSIRSLLSGVAPEVTVRPARPGEIGIVAARHMDYYGERYGFDLSLEVYLHEGMTRFLKHREGGLGQAWVADREGEVVGSIAMDHAEEHVAQLRWLLVEPGFRRTGLGRRLMEEALAFCRANLYRRVFLWTFSELEEARRLYELFGFSPTEEVSHQIWGKDLTEERWDILLFDPDED